ncbi:MAG: hypothetical protein AB1635_09305 [Acidobacteriota bacterium]
MTVDRWLEAARADAERRGRPELLPLLDGLAGATRALRAAAWLDKADGPTPRPPAADAEADGR